MNILLGSKSPRRNELLAQMGVDFVNVSIDTDESFDLQMSVYDVAEFLAQKKSQAYNVKSEDLLITADTVVIANSTILNKPSSEHEATVMLNMLSGKTHQVVTGVCLRTKEKTMSFSEKTDVCVEELSAKEIAHYIKRYKPFDKAGSYGIQEWFGMNKISGINGCYYNVVGLPCSALYKRLKDGYGVEI